MLPDYRGTFLLKSCSCSLDSPKFRHAEGRPPLKVWVVRLGAAAWSNITSRTDPMSGAPRVPRSGVVPGSLESAEAAVGAAVVGTIVAAAQLRHTYAFAPSRLRGCP